MECHRRDKEGEEEERRRKEKKRKEKKREEKRREEKKEGCTVFAARLLSSHVVDHREKTWAGVVTYFSIARLFPPLINIVVAAAAAAAAAATAVVAL